MATRKKTGNLLRSWSTLNKGLMDLSEKDLEKMLRVELEGSRRPHILRRLHQRLVRLRAKRERKEFSLPKHPRG